MSRSRWHSKDRYKRIDGVAKALYRRYKKRKDRMSLKRAILNNEEYYPDKKKETSWMFWW
jgi:ribosome-associated translation inhibitor RaiA